MAESVDIRALNERIERHSSFVTNIIAGMDQAIIGQKHLPPTEASLIMSLESVIAALCGWALLKERMTILELTGCALVFIAVILSQLPTQKTETASA